eukprot:scaffold311774_cov18-Tisochrysis_lutea.AAC.1
MERGSKREARERERKRERGEREKEKRCVRLYSSHSPPPSSLPARSLLSPPRPLSLSRLLLPLSSSPSSSLLLLL